VAYRSTRVLIRCAVDEAAILAVFHLAAGRRLFAMLTMLYGRPFVSFSTVSIRTHHHLDEAAEWSGVVLMSGQSPTLQCA